MSDSYHRLDALAEKLGCPVLRDEPMSRHTTFRIGGPADRLVKAPSLAALRQLRKTVTPHDARSWEHMNNQYFYLGEYIA